jgi:hypothetical protein
MPALGHAALDSARRARRATSAFLLFRAKVGNNGWYAMDVEFKFDDEASPGQADKLYVRQARPDPGRGTDVDTD